MLVWFRVSFPAFVWVATKVATGLQVTTPTEDILGSKDVSGVLEIIISRHCAGHVYHYYRDAIFFAF